MNKDGMIDAAGAAELKPSAVMRARHPDLFSDTVVTSSSNMSETVFEYHLETLTNRKQENEFEYFCRSVIEKEICPNLRPQTGPTGGGDAKVDTETYPVSHAIAERWWIGEESASKERWAFAFSAKKKWQEKAKLDVRKIFSTGRDYRKIFFVTNQFAKDSIRSKLEDSLSKEVGVSVTILDRTWLVRKVFDNKHLDLAIRTLHITGFSEMAAKRTGPRDTAREAELEALDTRVIDPTSYQYARYQLVEDCLRSALLARGLERTRNEVEKRFLQAARLAAQSSYRQQQLRVAYNRAWTAYFWHEDYAMFDEMYDEVESFSVKSNQAADLDLLFNLWQLLWTSIHSEKISDSTAKLEARTDLLKEELQRLSADAARPNNALQAKTTRILMTQINAVKTGDLAQVEKNWRILTRMVGEAQELGSYPFERLSELIRELGQFFDSEAFDELFERLADVSRKRRSDGEAGLAYLTRAMQKLDHNKPYDAIRLSGRAEDLLTKEEYCADLVRTLVGSSFAYERVGLLWAARAKALAAAERALSPFPDEGDAIHRTYLCMKRLIWLELQIGRIPYVMTAIEGADIFAAQLSLDDSDRIKMANERQMQDTVLGMLLMKTPLVALDTLSVRPGSF